MKHLKSTKRREEISNRPTFEGKLLKSLLKVIQGVKI